MPFAERQLQRARQRLWDALRTGADLQEVERLIDELQRALDKYLAAAAAELARRSEMSSPTDPGAKILKSEDLRDLIEMARQLARSGARDSARKLLADLQRILDRVRAGLHPGDKSKDLMEAHRLMSALRSVAEKQQELLDQTFEQRRAWDAARKGASGGKSSPESKRKAEASLKGPGSSSARTWRADDGARQLPRRHSQTFDPCGTRDEWSRQGLGVKSPRKCVTTANSSSRPTRPRD